VDTALTLRTLPADPETLRSLFLFEALAEEQLGPLVDNAQLIDVDTGRIFAEGDPARFFYVLVDGELAVSKRAGERDVETHRTTHRGTYCGATAAFIECPPEEYTFTVRVVSPSLLVRIDAEFFGEFMRTHYNLAVHMLQGLIVDHEGVHQIIDQQHRIAAAATISAGLMHGLNNPVGAITRVAAQLRRRHNEAHQNRLYAFLPRTAAAVYDALRCGAEVAAAAANASALEVADQEEAMCNWLAAHAVDEPWDIAPVLVAAGLDMAWLHHADAALTKVDAGSALPAVIAGIADSIDTRLLIDELSSASAEVSALVESAREYSQLDSSPLVLADIHGLLDSTLTVLSTVVGTEITVAKVYAAGVPPIACYAGELNQAWTNIIQNAVDAVQSAHTEGGLITIRTAVIDDINLQVEIGDNGPGIPSEVRERVFQPFFTTKPVGKGIGMGLDLAWRVIVGRHGGTLNVESAPGATRFIARIPLQRRRPSDLSICSG
jgi:signal transduction histidine kinase